MSDSKSTEKYFEVSEYNSLVGYEQWFRKDELELGSWDTSSTIITMFNKLIQEGESSDTAWKEENLGTTKNIRAWTNPAGSKLNNQIPYVRFEGEIPECISIDKLMNSLYNIKERTKWDSKVIDFIEIGDDHPNMSIVLSRNAKFMLWDGRQFFEKRIIFKDLNDDKEALVTDVYIYHSSIPFDKMKVLEEEYKPKHKKPSYVTGETFYSIQRITYNPNTKNNMKLISFNQIDGKMGSMIKIAAKALPKMTLQWFTSLFDYASKD